MRESTRREVCENHLHRIGDALQNYLSCNQHFPAGGSSRNELSWHVLVLPMLGYDALFDGFDLHKGPYHAKSVNHRNNPHGLIAIPEFECPTAASRLSESDADAVNDRHTYTVHYYGRHARFDGRRRGTICL